MRSTHSPLDEIHMVGQLADLKMEVYRLTIMVHALVDLFAEHEVITRKQFQQKLVELDEASYPDHPMV